MTAMVLSVVEPPLLQYGVLKFVSFFEAMLKSYHGAFVYSTQMLGQQSLLATLHGAEECHTVFHSFFHNDKMCHTLY